MRSLDNYQIDIQINSECNFLFELPEEKRSFSGMRANVFLTAATLVGAATLVEACNLKYDLKLANDYKVESLKTSEIVTAELSKYAEKLKSIKLDKFEIVEEILSFKTLENCWDGFQARPLGIKCAANAIKLIDSLENIELSKISDFYPNPSGTISFEWENQNDEIVSLEIGKETFSYFVSLNSVKTNYYNKQKFDSESIKMLKKNILAV